MKDLGVKIETGRSLGLGDITLKVFYWLFNFILLKLSIIVILFMIHRA